MKFLMKILGGGLTLLCASLPFAPGAQAQDGDFSRQYKTAIRSVVTIYSKDGSGSGFAVRMYRRSGLGTESVIVTNAHVVGTDPSVRVVTADLRSYNGEVLARYPDDDVAFVSCGCVPVLPLAAAPPEIGSRAYVIGSPSLGQGVLSQGSLTSGIVSNLLPADDFVQVDASINHGNSGGPVLNSRGEVIAMATAIVEGKPGLNFAISALRIGQIMNNYDWAAITRSLHQMQLREWLLK